MHVYQLSGSGFNLVRLTRRGYASPGRRRGLQARRLLEHDPVDEVRLMVFPVVLGTGKRLFGETTDKKSLRLVNSQTVGDGIAILIYEPGR